MVQFNHVIFFDGLRMKKILLTLSALLLSAGVASAQSYPGTTDRALTLLGNATTSPLLYFNNKANATNPNTGIWQMLEDTNGSIYLQAVPDNYSTAYTAFRIDRSATGITGINLFANIFNYGTVGSYASGYGSISLVNGYNGSASGYLNFSNSSGTQLGWMGFTNNGTTNAMGGSLNSLYFNNTQSGPIVFLPTNNGSGTNYGVNFGNTAWQTSALGGTANYMGTTNAQITAVLGTVAVPNNSLDSVAIFQKVSNYNTIGNNAAVFISGVKKVSTPLNSNGTSLTGGWIQADDQAGGSSTFTEGLHARCNVEGSGGTCGNVLESQVTDKIYFGNQIGVEGGIYNGTAYNSSTGAGGGAYYGTSGTNQTAPTYMSMNVNNLMAAFVASNFGNTVDVAYYVNPNSAINGTGFQTGFLAMGSGISNGAGVIDTAFATRGNMNVGINLGGSTFATAAITSHNFLVNNNGDLTANTLLASNGGVTSTGNWATIAWFNNQVTTGNDTAKWDAVVTNNGNWYLRAVNYAYTNATNVIEIDRNNSYASTQMIFTTPNIHQSGSYYGIESYNGSYPTYEWYNGYTSGSPDIHRWDTQVDNSGNWYLRAVNDNYNNTTNVITIARNNSFGTNSFTLVSPAIYLNGTVAIQNPLAVSSGGTGTSTGAWTTYTPSISYNGGSGVVTNSDTRGEYLQIGKTIWFRLQINTSYTTPPGSVNFTLPVGVALNANSFSGLNYNAYQALVAFVSGGNGYGSILLYNGATPFTASGQYLIITGNYQTT